MDWSTWIDKKVYSRLKNVLPEFLNRHCELCLEINYDAGFICSRCEDFLPQASYRCKICAIPLPVQGNCGQCLHKKPAFDYSHSSFSYAHPIDNWLQRLKTKRRTEWAHRLASLMLNSQPEHLSHVDIFTFVPSSRWSLIKRGFNPAELIARELGHALKKPVVADLATRSHSRNQKELNRHQRINNVSEHFHPTRKKLKGEHVMLIDDVMTTGSTAHSMALLLKQSGASKVGIWCLARTPKH
jgi:ComF family protein|tara:strand:+ start:4192 stop:4917 length:726 start_codon:yes stop_codon:yes gene_type:complete